MQLGYYSAATVAKFFSRCIWLNRDPDGTTRNREGTPFLLERGAHLAARDRDALHSFRAVSSPDRRLSFEIPAPTKTARHAARVNGGAHWSIFGGGDAPSGVSRFLSSGFSVGASSGTGNMI